MKVVVVGGSSHGTPGLFEYLSSLDPRPAIEFLLLGRDRGHLDGVARASKLLLRSESHVSIDTRLWDPDRLADAVEGATVVLVQFRAGGHAARVSDETFPLKFGICGDEALGPGGMAAAWRNWPVLCRILSAVARAAPGALVLLLTSPVGIMTEAARSAWPTLQVFGICELPWTTLIEIAGALGLDPMGIDYDYVGVSHLGWFYRLTDGSRDLLPLYAGLREGSPHFPSAEIIQRAGAIPTRGWRLHVEAAKALHEMQVADAPRGAVVERLARQAFTAFSAGSRDQILGALRARKHRWYDRAVGPLLAALAGITPPMPFFLSGPNSGSCPSVSADRVVEAAHDCVNRTILRRPNRTALPKALLQELYPFLEADRLVADALVHGDHRQIRRALSVHPWCPPEAEALDGLLNRVVSRSTDT